MHLYRPLLLCLLLSACGDSEPLTPVDIYLADGGRYRGATLNGQLQGQGRLDYDNGSWYRGDFHAGQRSGQGQWVGALGESYQGEFKAGLFDGTGHWQNMQGNHYRGEFKQGLPHGLGERLSADQTIARGQFQHGIFEGQGVLIDHFGNEFQGTFKQEKLQGPGIFNGADGSSYIGQFKEQRFDGQGQFIGADGSQWNGEFKQGRAYGQTDALAADGEKYHGQVRNWRYHGVGQLHLSDGSHYQGHFKWGQFNGQGTLTQPDGQQEQGTWQNGRRTHDQTGQTLSDPLELALLQQEQLLQQALDALPASSPQPDLYSLTFAGDGTQSVFMRETDSINQTLRQRFNVHGQISLVNHRDHLHDRPMATRENLSRAIQALAERSTEQDILLLYLTSHGSAEHELALSQNRLQLQDLAANDLAQLLKPLTGRKKILVVSACYSGGFIEPLKDENTLIMTAARADRTSFGCSDDSDFTYFGRALFAQALMATDDLAEAFTQAQKQVLEWETEQELTPSEPQIWAPASVIAHWNQWKNAHPARQPQSTD